MRYLGTYDVVAIAARVWQCESEDAVRRTDLDAVDRVLSDVRHALGLAEAAGVLLAGLVRARPFDGANRVVAVAVMLQFGSLNRVELRLEPVDEVDELLDRVATGSATDREVGEFLVGRLEHSPVTADDLQEHLRLDLVLEDELARLDVGAEREWHMFEKFTDPARRVVVLSQEEARGLDHVYIGTEHLLLGLLVEGRDYAARALSGMGIDAPAVRKLVVEIIGRGGPGVSGGGHIPFTPRAKTTFEYAWDEARRMGADKLGTEHLLLGLLRDGEGVAGQILTKLTSDPDQVRLKVEELLDRRKRSESAVAGMLDEDSATWMTFGRRHHLLAELNSLLNENERLHEQVAHLRDLLRQHDIDPDS
ncbi:Clp protease N-terminal domain-containing protein [Kribbella sp. NPDC051952]|uniref:Clp protease N-terminal domain-containing protein n=1 Tax=Kribbella sp. NPDC051952 TaxID=3154851 RepID=UPI00342E5203